MIARATLISTYVSLKTLGAHQDTLVGFTVHVPHNATPGDHLAGMAFENAHPTPGSGPISITSVVRTVVGILVKVPGAAVFHVSILGVSIQPLSTEHLASVVISTVDDGGLLGHPIFTLSLTGPNGYAKTVTRAFDTMLPGDTIALPFPWPDNLAAGLYRITVNASAAEMTGTVSYSGTYTLNSALGGVPPQATPGPAGTGSGNKPAVEHASASGSSLPTWVVAMMIATGALLLGLLGMGIALLRVVRRQRDKRVADATRPVSPPG